MSGPEIVVLADPEAVAHAAAERFRTLALSSIAERDVFRVALAGGATPRRCYEILATPDFAGTIDWSRVIVFFGDERMVPPDHEDSNYRMANETLLSRVPIPAGNVHRMRGEAESGKAAAREYEALLAAAFADSAGEDAAHRPPSLDLILLGLGPDAHTASLFPETPALTARRRWVLENPGPPPHHARLTLSLRIINAARSVLFLVTGKEKADAVRRVLKGERDPWRFPAQGVSPGPGRMAFLLDRDAASQL